MHEESIFLAALDLPPTERAEYLTKVCGDDSRLRERLEELLASSDQPSGMLDGLSLEERETPAKLTLAAGQPFAGRYVLGRQLGVGGMGQVWSADQTTPVRRPVALKMIRTDLATAGMLARFDQERQALAVMEHPHIAKVFDAGVADGLPFLAMELVEGLPITKFCEDRELTIPQRLELFVLVCRAVQHAHQKGVIHRDLKPANVLVANVDGQPLPKVIDFGIAKAAGVKLSDRSLHTGHGDIMGTLEYMAPEQASGDNDVDTRADIYALGVILYELLLGKPPIRRADFHEHGGLLDLLQAIQEQEPVPPSRQLSSKAFGEDLDWIVLKCLEKDRSRRYQTAEGLARDIQRYLSDEVVEAKPPSNAYRIRKFVRRHRPQVAATGVALLALVIGGAVAIWQAIQATAAEKQAISDRDDKEKARQAEAAARQATVQQLWKAQLNQAAATAKSNLPGQRSLSLAQLREALATVGNDTLSPENRSEFRNVAVAALGLPDLEVVKEWQGYPADAHHVTIDARLQRYARSDKNGAVTVRRVVDDQELYSLPGDGHLAHLAMSGDGELLAVASNSGSGHVYRLIGSTLELLLTTPMDVGRAPYFSRDLARLVFLGEGTIKTWERNSGTLHSWPTTGKPHGAAALSADGKSFAFGCQRDKHLVVRIQPLSPSVAGYDLPLNGHVEGISWHPDGQLLALYESRLIRLWDVVARKELAVLQGHTVNGGHLAFDTTGDVLFSNDWLGLLRMWNWRSGQQLMAIPAMWTSHDRFVVGDGQHLFVHGPSSQTLRIIRYAAGQERQPLGRPHPLGTDALADPKGRFILRGGTTGMAAVDPVTNKEWGRLGGAIRAFHITPSGELLTASKFGPHWWPRSEDPVRRVIRFGPPEWIGPPFDGGGETHGASTDGRVIAVPNSYEGAVVLFRGTGEVPAPTGQQEYVRTVAVNPDGRWVATGSHDSKSGEGAKVWHARTGQLAHTFRLPGRCPVGFSPDGRWLVTGGGGLRLWHVETWEQGPPVPHAEDSVGWSFAPAGDMLAVGGHGGVWLIRPADGVELARLPLPGQGMFQPRCFAHDGSRLYVTDLQTKGILLWDLRLLRRELAELGLDWDAPPFGSVTQTSALPWRVEFVGRNQIGREWSGAVKAAFDAPHDMYKRTRLAALASTPEVSKFHASLALLLDPKRTEALYYRARAHLQLKQYDEAAKDAEAVLRAVPGHFDATRVKDVAKAAMSTKEKTPQHKPSSR